MGVYSAVLGFFIPSGGGKWLLEAPYVMQAANELQVHLGWAVQVYNAAAALPNLINPFWMLPLLGILGLRARDIVGFTFLQLVVHLPLVLFLLWFLAKTLTYLPPVIPGWAAHRPVSRAWSVELVHEQGAELHATGSTFQLSSAEITAGRLVPETQRIPDHFRGWRGRGDPIRRRRKLVSAGTESETDVAVGDAAA